MAEERKLVTILFADVTGSTALGDALDPEDLRALMARYFAHAREIVSGHGGTLEKFIGDAVMAVFGLPQAHGNDAERALAAALALRAAIASDALLADRLILRLGVNTGEVVASNEPARGDFLVTGDAVNVAARLEQVAQPGEILASERTQAAVRAVMRFGAERHVAVKGKPGQLKVFPLLGPRPTRQIGRPPLVDRKPDLALLTLLRDRAQRERQPQLVSIIAPAGTGKTRLLEEFVAHLPCAAGFCVATARCLPYGQSLTYWPLRGLLEGLLGEAFTPERVAAALVAGGHPQDEADRLAGLVLAALGIELEANAEREQIFNAWRIVLEALARAAPRIIIFEDLHWASESLLDLVEHLVRPRTQAALLLISTSRPELLDRRPAWGGGRRSFTTLVLEPLDESQTRSLVRSLARKLPEATREQIVERSGGNPFFAIELTRAATESHAREPGGAPAREALPDTVHEAVLARLDQLAPREKAVLQAASVAGRTFRLAALRALVTTPVPGGLEGALDTLLARDLIAPADAETDAYTFRHILIRDVTYGTLARGERIRLHAATAAWLEQLAAGRLDEFAELIAYHYQEAVTLARQSAVPIELPFAREVAARSLERAGEVASRIGAVLEAQRHLEAAIALAPPAEHLRLYEKLGDCVRMGEGALGAYHRALAEWRARGAVDPLIGARLLRKILIIHIRWQGSVAEWPSEEEMEACHAEACRLVEASGDDGERWRLRVVDLFWPFWLGYVTPEAEAECRRIGPAVTQYFESRGQWEAASEALDAYGSILVTAGAFADAAEISRRRLALPRLSYFERGDACAMLACAHCDAGDYAGCLVVARQTAETLGSGLSPTLLGNTSAFAAYSAYVAGRWTELDEFTARATDAWEAVARDASPRYLWRAFFPALHVATARQDHASAERALAALRRLDERHHDPLRHALLAAYRTDDACALDRPDIARERSTPYVMAAAIMFVSERATRDHPNILAMLRKFVETDHLDALCRAVAIAEALEVGNDTRLEASIEDAEAHGLVPHAARMRIVLAQRTGDRSPLERARPVLEGLGDRHFLRRLAEVAEALS